MRRRTFLGAALGAFIGCKSGRKAAPEVEGGPAPTRLLIIHKPCGTQSENYECAGGERDFELSPILEPLAEFRSQMVIVDGIDIRKRRAKGQEHGQGMVTFMTGTEAIADERFRAPIAEQPSIDHILARDPRVVGQTPLRSLQLAADVRSSRDEVFTRVLTYAGHAAPVFPQSAPSDAFARAFGSLMDGGADAEKLRRARARKQSVLDYARRRLKALGGRLRAEERDRLESHAQAIRELERMLDRASFAKGGDTLAPIIEGVDGAHLDNHHGDIGLAHLDIVRTAFQCDMTRIATFGWAPGNANVNLSRVIPGVEDLGYHRITHEGVQRDHDETAIHRFYNERLAEFLRAMQNTPDGDGATLLDNTLIVVWSEIRRGKHTFWSIPLQLFGGAGGRLEGGRKLDYGGRSSNDLWATISTALGRPMEFFTDRKRSDGHLEGLFTSSA